MLDIFNLLNNKTSMIFKSEKRETVRYLGAYGHFQLYKSLKDYTVAKFLGKSNIKIPVFARFSTGNSDTERGIREFSLKFYAEDVFDLIGYNIPVYNGFSASSDDDFWLQFTINPDNIDTVMWLMSDRAIPRSLRMMEGYGKDTYRFINSKFCTKVVRFIWKPLLGVHTLNYDEAVIISGKNPDFLREDLHGAILNGYFPEYELCIQTTDDKNENINIRGLWKEEEIPLKPIGLLTLNRFAVDMSVTGQFDENNIVKGIVRIGEDGGKNNKLDRFAQAAMFWSSMSETEKKNIIDAFSSEAGSVKDINVRQKIADILGSVDKELSYKVAENIGVYPPENISEPKNITPSKALSLANTIKSVSTRKVAVLLERGFDIQGFKAVTGHLKRAKVNFDTISSKMGNITSKDGTTVYAEKSFKTSSSVFYDGIIICGGRKCAEALMENKDAIDFVSEAFGHMKTVAAYEDGIDFITSCNLKITTAGLNDNDIRNDCGVVTVRTSNNLKAFSEEFLNALSCHRHWCRNKLKSEII